MHTRVRTHTNESWKARRSKREAGEEMEETVKIPVVAIGYQVLPGGFRKLLVNEPSGSTHVYNPERHFIIKANEKTESNK